MAKRKQMIEMAQDDADDAFVAYLAQLARDHEDHKCDCAVWKTPHMPDSRSDICLAYQIEEGCKPEYEPAYFNNTAGGKFPINACTLCAKAPATHDTHCEECHRRNRK